MFVHEEKKKVYICLYWKVYVRTELIYLILYKMDILIVETESSQLHKNLQ